MITKIESKSHPRHYLMHKYWGRKAHNLVAEYIKHYTKGGDTVLDPFMGSGGVIIESKKSGRNSIGIDINPITKLIIDNTLVEVDLEKFLNTRKYIIDNLPDETLDLSITKCPVCNQICTLSNAVWNLDSIIRIKGHCSEHGIFKKDADNFDIQLSRRAAKMLKQYTERGDIKYPTEQLLDFVRRNGKKYINELFSDRNLLQSATLLKIINDIEDEPIKKLYQMVFTSMLPNISSMIPANPDTVTGKSGWQISKFWVPKCHTEKNVLNSFESRIKSIYAGKLETQDCYTDAYHQIHITSAENMPFIPDSSIDYIFTDPPYGNSIAYLGLSMFWNSWLEYKVNYNAEIIHDTYRKKDDSDYSKRLHSVFKELYRVLRPGKHLSFTFHNRHVKFWKIIIDAVIDNGFILKDVAWQSQAVNSGTQGLNRRNTLKGDFVYTFVKPKASKKIREGHDINGEKIVLKGAESLFNSYEFIETTKLYEHIIPLLVSKRAFLDSSGNILNIDKLLAKHYKYKEVENSYGHVYGWIKQ